ncbi:MAG: hypothetical protein KGL39_01285 [Patescibacteria group bacterium]|nr:hypothetical protein [Patescibacteria group bacterium]
MTEEKHIASSDIIDELLGEESDPKSVTTWFKESLVKSWHIVTRLKSLTSDENITELKKAITQMTKQLLEPSTVQEVEQFLEAGREKKLSTKATQTPKLDAKNDIIGVLLVAMNILGFHGPEDLRELLSEDIDARLATHQKTFKVISCLRKHFGLKVQTKHKGPINRQEAIRICNAYLGHHLGYKIVQTEMKKVGSRGHTKNHYKYQIDRQNAESVERCAKYSQRNLCPRLDSEGLLKKCQQKAQMRKGRCLAVTIIGMQVPVKWSCQREHEWDAAPSRILYFDTWCPMCASGKNENDVRDIIERFTGERFPKRRGVLKANKALELDGYCEKLGIAFEYHGKQHYEHVQRYHGEGTKKLDDQKFRDAQKAEACIDQGIALIVVPYTEKKKETYIRSELERLGVCEVDQKPLGESSQPKDMQDVLQTIDMRLQAIEAALKRLLVDR